MLFNFDGHERLRSYENILLDCKPLKMLDEIEWRWSWALLPPLKVLYEDIGAVDTETTYLSHGGERAHIANIHSIVTLVQAQRGIGLFLRVPRTNSGGM